MTEKHNKMMIMSISLNCQELPLQLQKPILYLWLFILLVAD